MRKRKIIRKRKVAKLSKSLVVKILMAVILLGIWLYIFLGTSPEDWQTVFYAPFFVSLGLMIFAVINIFWTSWAVKVFVPLGIVAILFLRSIGLKENLNIFLIIGLVISLIYFFTVEDKNDKLKKGII